MILDTNGLLAMADGDLEQVIRKANDFCVPVIVLGEYRYGVWRSREREHYEKWLAESIAHFRILDVDAETTTHYAQVRTELKDAGTPIPSNDVWIAALCRQYALPLLSRDRHFDSVGGVRRIGW